MLKDKTALYGRIAKACLAAINSQTNENGLDPNAIATVYGAIDQAFEKEQMLLATEMSRYQQALEAIAQLSPEEAANQAVAIAQSALDTPKH